MILSITEADQRLTRLVESIDIPPSYYEKAVKRYKSISGWLCRDGAVTAPFDPSVYVQGSFRLGLVNRPIGPREEYDLDLVCELRRLEKVAITQQRLKSLLGAEIKLYAEAHGISEEPVERKRCWRIDYADEVKFHIDNLVCVPEDANTVGKLLGLGVPSNLAEVAIALTCTEHPKYRVISTDWPSSNPSGYGLWFEGRLGSGAMTRRILLAESGLYKSIEDVPTYALKTPLQRSIQLLKRHRDFMFQRRADLKPISMIITTLSALSYREEENLFEALSGILERMPTYVRDSRPRVLNPVNPAEDFADKWATNPELEDNFWNWHEQARHDFECLTSSATHEFRTLSEARLGIQTPQERNGSPAIHTSRRTAPVVAVSGGPRPWGCACSTDSATATKE